MCLKLKVCWFLCFSLLIIPPTLFGDENYTDKRWGFFWYDDTCQLQKKEEEKVGEKRYTPLESDNYTYNELWDMHPDKFQNILNTRKKLAVQYPEDESYVLKFIEAQDVAKRKSLAFASSLQLVAQKNPQFDEDTVPKNIPGKRAHQRVRKEKNREILSLVKDKFGLIVFVSSNCAYCQAQRPVIEMFQNQYGWITQELEIAKYYKLADRYAVDTTPAIIIVSKENGSSMSISRGVITLPELTGRVINAVLYLTGARGASNFIHDLPTDPLKFQAAKKKKENKIK